jgi:methylmalonyl-CoA mutase
VIATAGFGSSGDIGAAFAASPARIACICGADATYDVLAEATAMALKTAGASHVLMAAKPGADAAALRSAGVDQFLFAGLDVVDALQRLHEALGVSRPQEAD